MTNTLNKSVKNSSVTKMLTIRNIMDIFGVGRDKAYTIMYQIPGYKVAGKLYAKPADLEKFLERNKL